MQQLAAFEPKAEHAEHAQHAATSFASAAFTAAFGPKAEHAAAAPNTLPKRQLCQACAKTWLR